jgi:hypothetical protein
LCISQIDIAGVVVAFETEMDIAGVNVAFETGLSVTDLLAAKFRPKPIAPASPAATTRRKPAPAITTPYPNYRTSSLPHGLAVGVQTYQCPHIWGPILGNQYVSRKHKRLQPLPPLPISGGWGHYRTQSLETKRKKKKKPPLNISLFLSPLCGLMRGYNSPKRK